MEQRSRVHDSSCGALRQRGRLVTPMAEVGRLDDTGSWSIHGAWTISMRFVLVTVTLLMVHRSEARNDPSRPFRIPHFLTRNTILHLRSLHLIP